MDLEVAVPLDDNLLFHVAVASVNVFLVATVDVPVSQASRVVQICRPFVLVSTEHSQTNRS